MISEDRSLPVNDDEAGGPAPGPPKLFTRLITTRPGPPWDQARQAELEARLGAPARLSEVAYRLQRLDPWRPGKPVRYAAVYARAEEARQGLVAAASVGDREITVRFTPPAERARQARTAALLALAAAAAVVVVAALAGTVAARRADLAAALDEVQTRSAAKLREAARLTGSKREAVLLGDARLQGRRLQDVVADLDWAARAKAPDAHIEAFHWDHGFLAVEADGQAPPFATTDHPLQRSRTPIRPGVWLWGVSSLDPWSGSSGERRGEPR
jgi:hypothetical protein